MIRSLTISANDWQNLQILMGVALASALEGEIPLSLATVLGTINRLNEGQPGFVPYEITGGPDPFRKLPVSAAPKTA